MPQETYVSRTSRLLRDFDRSAARVQPALTVRHGVAQAAALLRAARAEGALELAPYVCSVDKVASEMLGWGLVRTTTLAEGGDRCDFRFKRGGQTCIASSVMVWQQG